MEYTNKKQVVCKSCGLIYDGKNSSSFRKTYNILKDGSKTVTLKSLCNVCGWKKYGKGKYYKINKNRKLIKELKNVPCSDCNVRYPWYVMEFDHIRGEKLFNIGAKGHSVSKDRLLKEIKKCEVVCSNCHSARTYERRKKG